MGSNLALQALNPEFNDPYWGSAEDMDLPDGPKLFFPRYNAPTQGRVDA